MFNVQIDLSEFQALRRTTLSRLNAAVAEAALDAAQAGRDHAKGGSWQDQTGRLRSEIVVQLYARNSDGAEYDIVSPTSYAPYVEYGTKAHWIRPKAGFGSMGPLLEGQSRRAKTDVGTHRVALRWVGPNGAVHFAKQVWHPGTSPTPFMRPAADVAGDTLIRSFERHWQSIVGLWN